MFILYVKNKEVTFGFKWLKHNSYLVIRVPQTLDFHKFNVFISAARPRPLSWSDAAEENSKGSDLNKYDTLCKE